MDDDPRWSEVSSEHLQASAEALSEVASVVSSTAAPGPEQTPLFVDLVNYEHGYFLSSTLHGFPILTATPELVREEPERLPSGITMDFAYEALAEWAEPGEVDHLFSDTASALVTPKGATEEQPFTWATVAGRPVADQIMAVLETLTSLVVRQSVSGADLAKDDDLPKLLRIIEEELARTTAGVLDSVTRSGWRAAAEDLRVRADQSGHPLQVKYRPTVFQEAELARRAPLLRETYNRLTPVREAVDRVTSGMARAMYIAGPGPDDVLRTLNDQFEQLGVRKFLAHALRDAFVCGNGVMVLADVTTGGMRLVPPEDLIAVHGDVATIRNGDHQQQIQPVLHLTGGRQLGSELGVSFLEPFVMTCANRDTFLSTLLNTKFVLASNVTGDALAWAERMRPYSEAQLRLIRSRTVEVLGHVTEQFVDADPDAYFEGQQRMQPAAGRVTLLDSASLGETD